MGRSQQFTSSKKIRRCFELKKFIFAKQIYNYERSKKQKNV